jgi:valyl-tRNA synthetase
VSRPNFIELCARLTVEDEKAFEQLWKTLGLSVDWSMTYATIGTRAQRVSQLAFLHLLQRGLAYQVEAPTLWDVDFKTAVAQAELEDPRRARRVSPHQFRSRCRTPSGATRLARRDRDHAPELIPACVALVAHPDDARVSAAVRREGDTPLFGRARAGEGAPLADPEKGSGIAMICTFGDITDVTWWRELSLPVRADSGGRHAARVVWGAPGWESVDASRAPALLRRAAAAVGGEGAREDRRTAARTRRSGRRAAPITHAVKFYEKGDRPLEIITSRSGSSRRWSSATRSSSAAAS